jgi:hypothetical protein
MLPVAPERDPPWVLGAGFHESQTWLWILESHTCEISSFSSQQATMGRVRTRTKNLSTKITTTPTALTPPSIPSLLEKAQDLIAQCDYELAKRFIDRILERSPTHAEAKEMLGIVQLETGEIDEAKKVRGMV